MSLSAQSSSPHPAPIPVSTPTGAPIWHCGRFALGLERVRVMGVLNVTPDSFSDGGRYYATADAVAQALSMVEEGADIVDVGGESTRPGASAVDAAEQGRRVLPVLRELRDLAVPLSLDTSDATLMRTALDLGVSIINDVRSFRAPGALEVLSASDCGAVIMHMQGEPQTMQRQPTYADVVQEVGAWLAQRRDQLLAAGVAPARIAVDPGFGFGKAHVHNQRLMAGLGALRMLDQPLLVGLSRKHSLGDITGRPVAQRLPASLAAALMAAQAGARIVRVHDVAATRDAIAVWEAVRRYEAGGQTGETQR